MDTIFMNFSKIVKYLILIGYLPDKIFKKRSDKYVDYQILACTIYGKIQKVMKKQ